MAIRAHIDPHAPGDSQRAAQRRALRLETSGLTHGGAEANVTIHNISAAGLLIESALDLAQGEQLSLDLPEAGTVTAMIVWRSERLYGCAFEQALSPAALAAVQLQGLAPEVPTTTSFAPSNTSMREALGTRLNRLRREAGLTLADVAAALGVSKPTVWAWEKGKARTLPERFSAIAVALGVSVEELAETVSTTAGIDTLIEDCRKRIADACNTTPEAVRIMIEL